MAGGQGHQRPGQRRGERGREEAANAEAELGAKRKPYDEDPLFIYLWQRGFGTGRYQSGNFVRVMDRMVADFIGFANVRPNYAALIEIPLRLREHATAQRAAAAGSLQALQPGELLRIGYRAGARGHLVAVSIDDAGTVTPLYPDHGDGLAVEPRPDVRYFPDSIYFTGHGRERLFLIMSERPLSVGDVEKAVRAAHESAHGDLSAASSVNVPGRGHVEQFTWLFEKP